MSAGVSTEPPGDWLDRNVRLEPRWYAGDRERANAYGRELLAMALDVIVVNHTAALTAVRQLTSSIPIVFVVVADPVGAGHVYAGARSSTLTNSMPHGTPHAVIACQIVGCEALRRNSSDPLRTSLGRSAGPR
jgi:hypothetical protein